MDIRTGSREFNKKNLCVRFKRGSNRSTARDSTKRIERRGGFDGMEQEKKRYCEKMQAERLCTSTVNLASQMKPNKIIKEKNVTSKKNINLSTSLPIQH